MAESLRDTVTAAFDEKMQDAPAEPAAPPVEPAAPVEGETEAAKAERTRDDLGRFAKEKADKEKADRAKVEVAAKPPVQQQAPAQPAKPRYQRPSTWRKETWGVWDKLNANQPLTPEEINLMAEEAIKRDQDFANGVSTYKREWETAKPLLDAMAPFMSLLEQNHIQPGQWISNLGEAHRQLSLGSPQQKAGMFVKLARDYNVPLEMLFVQGQDGRLYVNPNMSQQAPQQESLTPDKIKAIVEETATEREAQRELAVFASQKDNHPHFEEVRQTMLGLLQAGLADGLEDAYNAAIRHPRHSDIYEAQQEQLRQTDAAAKAEAARKQAEAARRKAVSPRSATPTSASGGEGKKGLRSTIESAFDETVSGRV